MIARTITLLATFVIATQALAQQQPPDWQTKAGTKLSFEVASIKPAEPGKFIPASFSFDPNDNFDRDPHGLFNAGFTLDTYIAFAYKLWLSHDQRAAMLAHQPDWVSNQRFVIEARAPSNTSKDQMRLMMQSLLAERFHLTLHFEKRDSSVLALTLIHPGKLGPNLRPHAEGPPCDAIPPPPSKGASADDVIFPPSCNQFGSNMNAEGLTQAGARNTTLSLIGSMISAYGHLDRTVVDQTGLTGQYDFRVAWLPEQSHPATASSPAGSALLEAIQEQLGLQLKPAHAVVETPIIDHVELPTEN